MDAMQVLDFTILIAAVVVSLPLWLMAVALWKLVSDLEDDIP